MKKGKLNQPGLATEKEDHQLMDASDIASYLRAEIKKHEGDTVAIHKSLVRGLAMILDQVHKLIKDSNGK